MTDSVWIGGRREDHRGFVGGRAAAADQQQPGPGEAEHHAGSAVPAVEFGAQRWLATMSSLPVCFNVPRTTISGRKTMPATRHKISIPGSVAGNDHPNSRGGSRLRSHGSSGSTLQTRILPKLVLITRSSPTPWHPRIRL
jgi:hypothetical protein